MVEISMIPVCRAISCCIILNSSLCAHSRGDEVPTPQSSTNPFYVLENGVKDERYPTPESQAQLVKRLGFAGMGHSGVEGAPERLAALDRHGLKLCTVYARSVVQCIVLRLLSSHVGGSQPLGCVDHDGEVCLCLIAVPCGDCAPP